MVVHHGFQYMVVPSVNKSCQAGRRAEIERFTLGVGKTMVHSG